MTVTQSEKAESFVKLHQGPAFVIANPWDAGSARILAALDFPALATSSWAAAAAHGRRDRALSRAQVLESARAIVDATDLPVSADLESGFGIDSYAVAETYRLAAGTGLVGASIEDVRPGSDDLFDLTEAAERVAAAVEATRGLGYPFLVTARADGFFHGRTDLDDVIERLVAFEKAGADVLMAPALPSLDAVRAVCSSIAKPFNFTAGIPNATFSVAELEAVGVRRISLAPSLYRAAMAGLVAAAREIRDEGTFGFVDTSPLAYEELAGFMRD